MLLIMVKQGYFDCIEPSGRVITTHFRDVDCCIGSLKYEADKVEALEPIEEFYQVAVNRGWPGEKIIEVILWHYHRWRYFRVGYLANRELTLGFIGHRGSGKSVAAAAVAIVDFMLNGYKVWSNMPIEVVAAYGRAWKRFKAEPLDKLDMLRKDETFQRGVVVLDEVNVSLGDATMYMSKTNRELSNFTQQMRKRGISILWTAQNYNTVDNRLKFQTDFCIWCEDCFIRYPGVARYAGELSHWSVMDVSGMSGTISLDEEMRTKYLMEKIVWTGTFHSRPWWHSYNTFEIQGKEPYSMKVMEENAAREGVEYTLPIDEPDPIKRLAEIAASREVKVIFCKSLYEFNKINTKSDITKIGNAFKEAGYEKKRERSGDREYYWELPELVT